MAPFSRSRTCVAALGTFLMNHPDLPSDSFATWVVDRDIGIEGGRGPLFEGDVLAIEAGTSPNELGDLFVALNEDQIPVLDRYRGGPAPPQIFGVAVSLIHRERDKI